MSEKVPTLTELKLKLNAIHTMEKALGKTVSSMNSSEKLERKEILRKLLGLRQDNHNEYGDELLENILILSQEFCKQHNVQHSFESVKVAPLPQDMFVKVEGNVLLIEKDFISKSDSKLVVVIIIHELYHKFVQNMNPDMVEVKHLRDHFGQQTITEMDIDSDVETYLFLTKKAGLNFNNYLQTLYNNHCRNNSQSIPRSIKVIRSVGSLLSIFVTEKTGVKHIITPSLPNFSTQPCYLTCLVNGRKFIKLPNLEPVIGLSSITSSTIEDYIDQVTTFCNEVYTELKKQIRTVSYN